MKKIIAGLLVAVMVLGTAAPKASAEEGRGGVVGFIAGCCFGVRCAADYNDGKEIHWREIVRLIPYANIVFMIWDGVDGASGKTRADFAETYGSSYF